MKDKFLVDKNRNLPSRISNILSASTIALLSAAMAGRLHDYVA